jgi:glycosyltransferase involved in cell wall biosynthesis
LRGGPLGEAVVKNLGLRLADRVVTQTGDQQEIAVCRWGAKATLVRSFCEPITVAPGAPESFLWIGGLADYKDPLAYLELVTRVPEAQFTMVVTPRPGGEKLAQLVRDRACSLPNLRLDGPSPRDKLWAAYAGSIALVSTSRFEGFPNTFMEAWSCGVPVLSLRVDPDGVIQRHRLGGVAGGSMSRLEDLVRSHWSARRESRVRRAAQEYIRTEHDPEAIGDRWAALIGELLS